MDYGRFLAISALLGVSLLTHAQGPPSACGRDTLENFCESSIVKCSSTGSAWPTLDQTGCGLAFDVLHEQPMLCDSGALDALACWNALLAQPPLRAQTYVGGYDRFQDVYSCWQCCQGGGCASPPQPLADDRYCDIDAIINWSGDRAALNESRGMCDGPVQAGNPRTGQHKCLACVRRQPRNHPGSYSGAGDWHVECTALPEDKLAPPDRQARQMALGCVPEASCESFSLPRAGLPAWELDQVRSAAERCDAFGGCSWCSYEAANPNATANTPTADTRSVFGTCTTAAYCGEADNWRAKTELECTAQATFTSDADWVYPRTCDHRRRDPCDALSADGIVLHANAREQYRQCLAEPGCSACIGSVSPVLHHVECHYAGISCFSPTGKADAYRQCRRGGAAEVTDWECPRGDPHCELFSYRGDPFNAGGAFEQDRAAACTRNHCGSCTASSLKEVQVICENNFDACRNASTPNKPAIELCMTTDQALPIKEPVCASGLDQSDDNWCQKQTKAFAVLGTAQQHLIDRCTYARGCGGCVVERDTSTLAQHAHKFLALCVESRQCALPSILATCEVPPAPHDAYPVVQVTNVGCTTSVRPLPAPASLLGLEPFVTPTGRWFDGCAWETRSHPCSVAVLPGKGPAVSTEARELREGAAAVGASPDLGALQITSHETQYVYGDADVEFAFDQNVTQRSISFYMRVEDFQWRCDRKREARRVESARGEAVAGFDLLALNPDCDTSTDPDAACRLYRPVTIRMAQLAVPEQFCSSVATTIDELPGAGSAGGGAGPVGSVVGGGAARDALQRNFSISQVAEVSSEFKETELRRYVFQMFNSRSRRATPNYFKDSSSQKTFWHPKSWYKVQIFLHLQRSTLDVILETVEDADSGKEPRRIVAAGIPVDAGVTSFVGARVYNDLPGDVTRWAYVGLNQEGLSLPEECRSIPLFPFSLANPLCTEEIECEIKCKDGYENVGNATIVCVAGVGWQGTPKCKTANALSATLTIAEEVLVALPLTEALGTSYSAEEILADLLDETSACLSTEIVDCDAIPEPEGAYGHMCFHALALDAPPASNPSCTVMEIEEVIETLEATLLNPEYLRSGALTVLSDSVPPRTIRELKLINEPETSLGQIKFEIETVCARVEWAAETESSLTLSCSLGAELHDIRSASFGVHEKRCTSAELVDIEPDACDFRDEFPVLSGKPPAGSASLVAAGGAGTHEYDYAGNVNAVVVASCLGKTSCTLGIKLGSIGVLSAYPGCTAAGEVTLLAAARCVRVFPLGGFLAVSGALVVVLVFGFFFLRRRYPGSKIAILVSLAFALLNFLTDLYFIYKLSDPALGVELQRNLAFFFLVAPTVLNVYWLRKVLHRQWAHAPFRQWLRRHFLLGPLFTLLGLINIDGLLVIVSKNFGLDVFDAPLDRPFETRTLIIKYSIYGVVLQDLPQLLVALWVMSILGIETSAVYKLAASLSALVVVLCMKAFATRSACFRCVPPPADHAREKEEQYRMQMAQMDAEKPKDEPVYVSALSATPSQP